MRIYLTNMSLSHKFFCFFITLSGLSSSNVVLGDKILSSIFTDDTFVDDDICSSIINEHPCVKNVLGVLVDHINDNLQRIKANDRRTKLLEEKLQQNEENLNILQNKLSNKVNEIKLLENKLLDIAVKNKKFKIKFDQLESIHHHRPHSSTTTFLNSFLKVFNKSYGIMKDGVNTKMDNATLVSYHFKAEVVSYRRNVNVS